MGGSKVYEQKAVEFPYQREVRLRMTNLSLYGFGVFSNVYKGTLLRKDGNKDIAIKKTWPGDVKETNFEVTFLSGENRRPHKNIVMMLYSFTNKTKDNKVCESFVFEFMPETLSSVIRNTDMDHLDMKLYTWQLFSGLHYLSCMQIVHRDLKPVNILVDPAIGLLRISDFGSAKVVHEGTVSTAYQVTRYYRPPELLLGSKSYDWTVDVWSGGCCLGEMMRKRTLFAGKDTKHQLRLVLLALGMPSDAELKAMKIRARFKGEQKIVANGFGKLIRKASSEDLQFLAKILVYNPKERFCGLELLKHTYFDELFHPSTVRHNGQPISNCVSIQDFKLAEIDQIRRDERLRDQELEREGRKQTISENTTGTKIININTVSGSEEQEQLEKKAPLRTTSGEVVPESGESGASTTKNA